MSSLSTPSTIVATVAPAIHGKLLARGRPTSKTNFLVPVSVLVRAVSCTGTNVTAKISGGCTMGPNRFRRRTASTATTHPSRNSTW
jgi:hypothetical protein